MSIRNHPVGRGLLPLAVALLVAGAAPALAQGEPTGMQKFLDAIGLIELPKDQIRYRERAPLVVPPSPALIPPRSDEDMARLNPDWPVDHDNRRRTARDIEAERKADEIFYSGARLSPSEMQRGVSTARRGPDVPAAGDADAPRLSPSQLGFKGWGSKKEEQVVFTGEPERRSLIEPPPGLRTPSIDAPYGVVTERAAPKKRDPFARE